MIAIVNDKIQQITTITRTLEKLISIGYLSGNRIAIYLLTVIKVMEYAVDNSAVYDTNDVARHGTIRSPYTA